MLYIIHHVCMLVPLKSHLLNIKCIFLHSLGKLSFFSQLTTVESSPSPSAYMNSFYLYTLNTLLNLFLENNVSIVVND